MKLQPLNKKQKQAQVKLGIMSPKNPGEKKIYSKNVKKTTGTWIDAHTDIPPCKKHSMKVYVTTIGQLLW